MEMSHKTIIWMSNARKYVPVLHYIRTNVYKNALLFGYYFTCFHCFGISQNKITLKRFHIKVMKQ